MDSGGAMKLADFSHAIDIGECNRWIGEEETVYEFDESLEDVLVWLAPEALKQATPLAPPSLFQLSVP